MIDKLSIDQTKDNPVDKFKWIPFGERLLSLFADHTLLDGHTLPDISRLQNNLALVLKDLGDYEDAMVLADKAYRVFSKALPRGTHTSLNHCTPLNR